LGENLCATVSKAIYTFYGTIYNRDRGKFEWAGLAKIAGGNIINALQRMETIADVLSPFGVQVTALAGPFSGNVEANVRAVQVEMVRMARDLFDDIAWQHVAYWKAGLQEMRRLVEERQIDVIPVDLMHAWELIDTANANDVDAGSNILLDREQNVVLERGYAKLRTMWLIEPTMIGYATGTPTVSVTQSINMGAYLAPFPGCLPFSSPPWDPWAGHYNDGTRAPLGFLADKVCRFGYILHVWNTWKTQLTFAQRDAQIQKSIEQLSQ
jgi:hypothetical protein